MTDSPCEDCGEWEAVHTNEHLAQVCLPATVRRLYLQVRDLQRRLEITEGDYRAAMEILKARDTRIDDANRVSDELRKALAVAVGQIREHNKEYHHLTSKETLAQWEALSQAEKREGEVICPGCGSKYILVPGGEMKCYLCRAKLQRKEA